MAPIGPQAWESLYATGVALKRQKKKKKEASSLNAEEATLLWTVPLGTMPPSWKQSSEEAVCVHGGQPNGKEATSHNLEAKIRGLMPLVSRGA